MEKENSLNEEVIVQEVDKPAYRIGEGDDSRTKAMKELASTEAAYVQNMSDLIKGYVKPLKWSGIIEDVKVGEIFSNIEILLRFHTEFLKEIDAKLAAWSSDQTIGDLFLDRAPYFKLYTQYCIDYDRSAQVLHELKRDNEKFSEFLKSAQQGERFGGAYITTYLIMPIQRLPRYVMLIQTLLKHTGSSHKDHGLLKKALKKVKEHTDFVNEACIKAENQHHMMDISRRMSVQDLVSPTRKFEAQYKVQVEKLIVVSSKSRKYKNREKALEGFEPTTGEIFLCNDILLMHCKRSKPHADMRVPLERVWFKKDVHPDATVKSQQLITPVVTVFVEFKDDATADNALHKFQTVQKTLLKDRCAKAVRDRYSLMIVEDIYRVGSMVKESDETDDVFVERESPKLRKISSTKGSSTGGLRNWRSNFFSNKGGKKQKDEDSSSEAVDVLMQRLKLNVKEVAVSTERSSRSIDTHLFPEAVSDHEQSPSRRQRRQSVPHKRRQSVPHRSLAISRELHIGGENLHKDRRANTARGPLRSSRAYFGGDEDADTLPRGNSGISFAQDRAEEELTVPVLQGEPEEADVDDVDD